jgi:hypothetical protein
VIKLAMPALFLAAALVQAARAESQGSAAPLPPRPTGPPCNGTLLNDPPIEPQPVLKSLGQVGHTLEFRGTVSREGKVENLIVLKSAHPAIDKIAMDALGARRYEPSKLPDGRTFSCGVTYTVEIKPAEWLIPPKRPNP